MLGFSFWTQRPPPLLRLCSLFLPPPLLPQACTFQDAESVNSINQYVMSPQLPDQ